MRGFMLDNSGDVVIADGDIVMIEDNDLLRQTVERVIGTNKGEWFLDEEEGINFRALLAKSPELEAVRDEIADGLLQIDDTFVIKEFSMEQEKRILKITFTAVNSDGEEVGGESEYGT